MKAADGIVREPARVFFCYPARPELRRETVATASDKLGLSDDVRAVTWEDLGVGGRLIISEILRGIDDSQACVFDITSLNQNVNRTDFNGDSIVWRNMESWQTTATTASGGIHLN